MGSVQASNDTHIGALLACEDDVRCVCMDGGFASTSHVQPAARPVVCVDASFVLACCAICSPSALQKRPVSRPTSTESTKPRPREIKTASKKSCTSVHTLARNWTHWSLTYSHRWSLMTRCTTSSGAASVPEAAIGVV